MNILIDIGHPAHYHYFKNFALYAKKSGHTIFFVAREKGIILELLKQDGWSYYNRGKGKKGFVGKLWYLLITDLKLLFYSIKKNIDFSIGFPSTYAAHASFLRGKPHYAFNDTEHASFERHLYPIFSKKIFTPFYFNRNIGKKQSFFNGFMESSYLNLSEFKPNEKIVYEYTKGSPFVLLRFISWDASHDWGKIGLTLEQKIEIVHLIREKGRKIVLSSEMIETIEGEDILSIPENSFHDFLFFADAVIGEGGTTCNEAALLGTPNILINQLLEESTKPGVHCELEQNGFQICCETYPSDIGKTIDEILETKYKHELRKKLALYLENKVTPTEVLKEILHSHEGL